MGACSTAIAALAHLVCIFFGASWYRKLGAGEQMAMLAEQGHWYPTLVTIVLVIVLIMWSLYALSGAGLIVRLPLLRLGLSVITCIFILRSLTFVWLMQWFPDNSLTFWLISSGICLGIGLCYAIGTYQSWSTLGVK